MDHYLWPTFPHLVFNNHVVVVWYGIRQRPATVENLDLKNAAFFYNERLVVRNYSDLPNIYLKIDPRLVPIDLTSKVLIPSSAKPFYNLKSLEAGL